MTGDSGPTGDTPPLEPLRNYLLAQEDRDGARTGAGMILPSHTMGQPAYACVREVGDDVKGKFAAGDVIVYKQADAVPVYVRGHEYLLVKADSVMAKLRPV